MRSRRGDLPKDIGAFQPNIESFRLYLTVNNKSANTVRIYTDAARWFAGWMLRDTSTTTWRTVTKNELRGFFHHMQELGYADWYRNGIARALQAYFGWLEEEDEVVPNPLKGLRVPPPPDIEANLVPVIESQMLAAVLAPIEKGRTFTDRRDAALIRFLASTGCRISEVTGLIVEDVRISDRTAVILGKGNRRREVRFDPKCALALDRYLRRRGEHAYARSDRLWVGKKGPLTANGIRQMVDRRGEAVGADLWPHLFRHTFSHNWLDAGGTEGDLMELNGWRSTQMLRRYGRSARGARARRAYDRIDVMRGV